MADMKDQAGFDAAPSVSTLGLRWAALRGMLNSPLITADDQRPLRDELLRELEGLEQDFSSLQARSTLEISAKVDVAKSALQDRLQPGQAWLVDLLESIQLDLHTAPSKPSSAPAPGQRSTANLSRNPQYRSDENPSSTSPEIGAPSAA